MTLEVFRLQFHRLTTGYSKLNPNVERVLSRRSTVQTTRRRLLTAGALATMTACVQRIAAARGVEDVDAVIRQPTNPDSASFMSRALKMRQIAIEKGDQAYGAIIVRDGVIVGQSWSRVVLDQDPTAHAELAAIRDAARRLRSRDLSRTTMYSSSQPCPMCEAAAYWAGVSAMIYGPELTELGNPTLCR